MEVLRRAAEAASAAYASHWLKFWTKAHVARHKRAQTTWARRMAVEGLFGDIETIMKDVKQDE